MNHLTFKDYNMDQLTLPMDISELIPSQSIARVVNEMIERVPDHHFLKYYSGVIIILATLAKYYLK